MSSSQMPDMDAFASTERANDTFNRQNALQRFALNDKLRKDRQRIVLKSDPHVLDSDDLLMTNNLDASFTNENTVGTLPNNRMESRYYQENYVYINVSSRERQRFIERPVIPEDRETFPNKEIWDEFFDPVTGIFGGDDLDLCCLTLNNVVETNFDRVLEFGQEFPYFFQRENQLFIQVPNDLEPNQYSVVLRPARRHVRSIRLVSVEPPRLLDVVNNQNNLVLIDVIDPCTSESIPHVPDPDLPFSMFLIPLGSYTIETLLITIVKQMNATVERCNPFYYEYEETTGIISFKAKGKFKFHMKFWFSTNFPQFNLWEMLGFEFPYPRDEQNEPAYVDCFTNAIVEPSPLTTVIENMKPFKRPRLDILDYIYLEIEGLGVIQDPQVPGGDLFGKILLRVDSLDQTRALGITKIFPEPLDRLERLRVRWVDPFGNLLDIKGQENSFLLEIVEYQDRLKDADFSSQRGLRNYDDEVTKVAYKQVVSI